jgi:outer membrane lipopolysaccharide assembly protein LptE/RlpB
MRIVELINHLQVPITNEESDVLGKFHEQEIIEKSQLDLREQHIANQLVNKDVLLRKNQDGKIVYKKKIR